MSIARWVLISSTNSNGFTGLLFSIKHNAVSIKIKTPVLPIPAEQWTMTGGCSLVGCPPDKDGWLHDEPRIALTLLINDKKS